MRSLFMNEKQMFGVVAIHVLPLVPFETLKKKVFWNKGTRIIY